MARDARRSDAAPQGGKGPLPRERWGSNGHRDPIAKYLASRLGLKSAIAAEKLMRSAPHDTAAIIDELFERGNEGRALACYLIVRAAFERIRPRAVRDVIPIATRADANNEAVRTDYLLNPCRATRRPLIAREKAQLIRSLELLVALEHEDATDAEALA